MIGMDVVALRVALAALFGAAVGVEREWRHKAAGIKTNMLVAVGGCAFAMVSNTFGPLNHNPAQIAAAVVSGIGFIGAGVIIHRAGNVQGVTTAATLWANAAMAVALGIGQYSVGIMLFVAMLFVQFLMRAAVRAIARQRRLSVPEQMEVRVDCEPRALGAVNKVWAGFAAPVRHLRRSTLRRGLDVLWTATFTTDPQQALDLQPLEERLIAIEGVKRVDVRLATADEE